MNSYETVNNILVKMFKDILDIEERALITSEYKDISVNDMHIMEAIGIQEPKNMSTVAKAVSVTTGTLTIAINHLVKKGYVERTSCWFLCQRKARRHFFITRFFMKKW